MFKISFIKTDGKKHIIKSLPQWHKYSNRRKVKTVLSIEGLPADCMFFFSRCCNLQTIPQDLDVSHVTNTSWMFSGCKKFNQSLKNWKISNVTNMMWMFHNCSSLNQSFVDWRVSIGTITYYMFEGAFKMKKKNFPKGMMDD